MSDADTSPTPGQAYNPENHTVAFRVMERLHQLGVNVVFGIPGTHNLELFRAISDLGIRLVTAHHEQGLGYAADGYSRVTGKPAVVITTTGPGITNLTTALATSRAASVPVLAIAPGLPESAHRREMGWLHDLPSQLDHLATLVSSHRADGVVSAIEFINATFDSWDVARRLPAYLELPTDVLESVAKAVPHSESRCEPTPPATRAQEYLAINALSSAHRIVIIAGRGACSATEEFRSLATKLGAAVMTTTNAKGLIDERDPQSLGVAVRLEEGKKILAEADCVLVVGSDLGPSELWSPGPLHTRALVRIDIDANQLNKNADVTFPLLGDARTMLKTLVEGVAEKKIDREWLISLQNRLLGQVDLEGSAYAPYHAVIQEQLPGDTVVAGDSSQATYFGSAYFWKADRPNRFLSPAGYGTLGYAVPAAIGAAVADQAQNVIAITGEGGFMFSVQEFATAAEMGLTIPVVVFSNGGYKEIRDGFTARGADAIGVDFTVPDFEALARSLGGAAETTASVDEFRGALSRAREHAGPTLIHIPLLTQN